MASAPEPPSLEDMASSALKAFAQVAVLAGSPYDLDLIKVEIRLRPHRAPTRLPAGQMAVYAFFHQGRALKVGKVGPNSGPRFTSQHYNPNSARSNLARSLLQGTAVIDGMERDELTIGSWILKNTDRVNLLLPARAGMPLLTLLEAFLHVRWMPMFEGRTQEI